MTISNWPICGWSFTRCPYGVALSAGQTQIKHGQPWLFLSTLLFGVWIQFEFSNFQTQPHIIYPFSTCSNLFDSISMPNHYLLDNWHPHQYPHDWRLAPPLLLVIYLFIYIYFTSISYPNKQHDGKIQGQSIYEVTLTWTLPNGGRWVSRSFP